jgi:hypothetical protein
MARDRQRMGGTLERLIEEARKLPPEKLRQVRELVESLVSDPPNPEMSEEELADFVAARWRQLRDGELEPRGC